MKTFSAYQVLSNLFDMSNAHYFLFFFCVQLLSVLRAHSVFSPRHNMKTDNTVSAHDTLFFEKCS